MSDIVDVAEKALAEYHKSRCYGQDMGHPYPLLSELVVELKAALAKIAKQEEWIKELTTSDE